MTIAEGTQLGPYEILEKIGSGGMGEVFRARDTRLNREVAIKFISDRFLMDDYGSGTPTRPSDAHTPGTPGTLSHRRFLREAQSSSALNHPNICTIYDIGEQDGRPYLIMELLRGDTLRDALRHGPLSPTEVLDFSRQAASALAAPHAQGIVHRDIKPANLFVVGPPGKRQIKILDFGLAKRQGIGDLLDSGAATAAFSGMPTAPGTAELTSPGSTVGTASYMSPEQARTQPLDSRTDLFSLGCVIYEMATGQRAFDGPSAADIFAALLTKNPPAISNLNPALPPPLDAIVAKLLAKDRDQRYQSADDLLRDLEAIGAHNAPAPRSATAPAAEVPTPTAPPASSTRRPGHLIFKLLLGAAVLVVAGLLWWRHRGPTPPAPPSPPSARAVGLTPALAKDSIILATFINHTGDPVFDTTLNEALRIDLEQSPVINIVSEDHLRQSVKYLGKPEDTPVTPEIARNIGEREGMKAILTGTIARLGNQYVIMLSAQNTATGDEIASEQTTAPDKEHVLEALNKAATNMRNRLGEDLASIKKLNTPFGQATTTSLEAFRAYALGDVAHNKALDIPEAEGHYQRAIELDPNFAMAYARLGVIYVNSGQVAKAKQYFTKAWSLAKRVSEAERLYIAGHYYGFVTGETSKQIEALQEAIQTYPGQVASYININVAYQQLGQFAQGLPYAQKAVELQPDDAIAGQNLLADYIALNRLDDVRQEMDRQHRMGMDSSTGTLSNIIIADFLLGRPQDIQQIIVKTTGRPDEFTITATLAATQEYSGEMRLSSATFQQAIDQAGRAHAPDVQAAFLLQDAEARGLAGQCDGIESVFQRALSLDKSKQTLQAAALTTAVCGDSKHALPTIAQLAKDNPQDEMNQRLYIPLTRAFADLAEHHPQKTVDDVGGARSFDAVFPASYVQGLAYLQLHDANDAIKAFSAATKSPTGVLTSVGFAPFYAEAQLGLARAYAMAGDKASAKSAYQAFFTTWKGADADIPVLVAAKKEFASL
jgi:serine/threonine protein kinase/Tfp pilus assembly protein PilF